MAGGRPTTYKEEYCQKVISFMSQGYSLEAFAGEINTHKDTVYEWIKVHSEFSDAVKDARAKCQKYWEDMGIDGMSGKIQGFNAATYIFNMKNRFGWKDRQDITSGDARAEPLVIEIVREKKLNVDHQVGDLP